MGRKGCGGPPLGSPTKEVGTPFQAPHLCVSLLLSPEMS